MIIPEEYIIQKFYQHAGYPKFVKSTNTYMGGCPICREGKSWGRKSRLYYISKDNVICCRIVFDITQCLRDDARDLVLDQSSTCYESMVRV